MSYILDALRKSETERQQGRVPDLAQSVQMVHKPRRKPIPLAAWVAIGFFVNALVLAVIFWPGTGFLATTVDAKTDSPKSAHTDETAQSAEVSRSGPGTPSPVAPAQTGNATTQGRRESPAASGAAAQARPPASGTAANTSAGHAMLSLAGESSVTDRPAASGAATKTGQRPDDVGVDYVAGANQQEEPATLIVPQRSRDPMSTMMTQTPTQSPETAEHLMEKSLAYQRRIPTLHFSSHIYASNPASRRVTINGHYLRVGDGFDGIRVKAINPDGVILSAYGERFRVGVVTDWISPR